MILCDKVWFICLINLSTMVIQPMMIESDFLGSRQVVVNDQVKINVTDYYWINMIVSRSEIIFGCYD